MTSIFHYSARIMLFAGSLMSSSLLADEIIYAGKMIDVEHGTVRTKVSLRIVSERIQAIENGFVSGAAGDTIIHLENATLLPGFIDMHVHLTKQNSAANRWEWYQLNPADYAIRSVVYAHRTLLAGFTTVRDLGSDDGVVISLRNAINDGLVSGPRIYAAGTAIGSLGGHMDPTEGLNNALKRDPGPQEGVINSAEDARKAVRARYKEGADLIKVAATGGVLDSGNEGDNAQLTSDELNAIVTTAHDYNMTVAVHAHGREGMYRAVMAGVDSIEHGTYMDDVIRKEMKKRGTYLVPTLSAGKFVASKAEIPNYFPEVVRKKAATIGPLLQTMLATAYKNGIKIAFGTDTGVSAHGDNANEFIYMTEAGMPAMAVIQSATINAATLLKKDHDLGSISVGKFADIVAVEGDPLADIKILTKIQFVMKAGKVEKQ